MSETKVTVDFAVYGALVSGSKPGSDRAANVKSEVQSAINANNAEFRINNSSLGSDPSPGQEKHFGAQITRNGQTYYYACKEGQKLDFLRGGSPA
ncbi:hypothetical protein [Winogradskyella sp.]|uniref:hypothetical protein n=1 Tax=Winogradskyella sp. TaxID=1883156 RepID=UPI0025EB9E2A|nr:hypothetical protein [Winogradskyella sp.]